MPNYCDYEMKIKGGKKAIERIEKCLTTNYDYNKEKTKHKHFFRVFEANVESVKDLGNGEYIAYIWGNCAWSVNACMLGGDWSYYQSVKKSYKDIFMGTTLQEQSKDCEIEVFSEECGCGFGEHFKFKNGKCLCSECVEAKPVGYDENDEITEDIDWETYDGDVLINNPLREGIEEGYRWSIVG